MEFSKQTYLNFLIQQEVVGLCDRPIELKSGKKSFWYANFRKTIQSYQKLAKLTCILADFIEHNLKLSGLDAVIGVPEGSSILGYELQKELVCRKTLQDQIFQFRLKPKTHGDNNNRYWVNGNKPKKVLLLEDVLTTGGSCLDFIEHLQKMEVCISGVIGLLDRQQLNSNGDSIKTIFKKKTIPCYILSQASEVLPLAISCLPAKKRNEMQDKILAEYEKEYNLFSKPNPLSPPTMKLS